MSEWIGVVLLALAYIWLLITVGFPIPYIGWYPTLPEAKHNRLRREDGAACGSHAHRKHHYYPEGVSHRKCLSCSAIIYVCSTLGVLLCLGVSGTYLMLDDRESTASILEMAFASWILVAGGLALSYALVQGHYASREAKQESTTRALTLLSPLLATGIGLFIVSSHMGATMRRENADGSIVGTLCALVTIPALFAIGHHRTQMHDSKGFEKQHRGCAVALYQCGRVLWILGMLGSMAHLVLTALEL